MVLCREAIWVELVETM